MPGRKQSSMNSVRHRLLNLAKIFAPDKNFCTLVLQYFCRINMLFSTSLPQPFPGKAIIQNLKLLEQGLRNKMSGYNDIVNSRHYHSCIPVKHFAALSQGEQKRESRANLSAPETEKTQTQGSHYEHSFFLKKN